MLKEPDGAALGDFISWILQYDPKGMFDLVEVRQSLEVQSVGLAAQRATRPALAAIESQVDAMRAALKSRAPADTSSDAAKAIRAFRARIDTVGGNAGLGGRRPAPNFYALNGTFGGQLTGQDNADQAPPEATLEGYAVTCRDLKIAITNWTAINSKGLADLNAALGKSGVQTLSAAAALKAPECAAKIQSAAPTPRNK